MSALRLCDAEILKLLLAEDDDTQIELSDGGSE